MIEINEEKLNITVPETGLCISQMQPFLKLVSSEPYKWQQDKINKQLDRIYRFMKIAKTFDGNGKSHFTILPEYSIPGIKGVYKINQFLTDASWPSETIVIGGVDGLSKDEYTNICNNAISFVSLVNAPDQVEDGKWVNCCITWVKERNGELKRWIQPKISPSWPEKNITHSEMFCGNSVNLFTMKFTNNTDCKFLSLICFDWIGTIHGIGNGIFEILNHINKLWQRTAPRKEINLVLLLQRNAEPNHRDFLENARNFFEDRVNNPSIVRDYCVLFFVNTAGKNKPGKSEKYGYSSLIASYSSPYDIQNCCPLSFSSDTSKLRNSKNLGRCKEALFRENGACFHLFKFLPPSFISARPGNRCLFLNEAKVYSIDEGIDDPRVPGGPVAASVKWVNDEIDIIKPITFYAPDNLINYEVNQSHKKVSKEIRKASGESLCRYIQYSFCKYEHNKKDSHIHFVDRWGDNEKKGLETIIHTLSIMRICNKISISQDIAHATMTIANNVFDIIVVHGGDTTEKCFEYVKSSHNSLSRYVIVITRDIQDRMVDKKINGTILHTHDPIYERGPNITNPDDRFILCGFQNIKSCYFSATSVKNLKKQIECLLEV